MKIKLIIAGLCVLAFLAFYLNGLPGHSSGQFNQCPDSKPIIINGSFAACTNYKYEYVPMWTPPGKPAKLQKCAYCDGID